MSTELRVSLNVGGKLFMTTGDTLLTYPDSLLGRMAAQNSLGASQQEMGDNPPTLQLFFDRNPEMVNSLLDFYRTGELHLPGSLCSAVVERELRFWGVPVQVIKECCWRKFENDLNDAQITEEIDGFLKDKFVSVATRRRGNLRLGTRMWLSMEHINYSRLAKMWHILYYCVVAFSVLNFFLYSTASNRKLRPHVTSMVMAQVQALNLSLLSGLDPAAFFLGQVSLVDLYLLTEPLPWLLYSEMACYAFFFLDFSLRLAVCPNRKLFFKQFKNVVDIFLFVHYATLQLVEFLFRPKDLASVTNVEKMALIVFYSLALTRVFRVFVFARAYAETQIMALVARASRRYFLQLVILVLTFVSLFGTLMYIVEIISADYSGKSTAFVSIPAGLWWAVVTMTTVGYGDLYPVSVMGQCVAALCALMGVMVLAAPVGMLGYRFSDYHRNMSSQKQKQDIDEFLYKNPSWARKKPVDNAKRTLAFGEKAVAWDSLTEVAEATDGSRDTAITSISYSSAGIYPLRPEDYATASMAPSAVLPEMTSSLNEVNRPAVPVMTAVHEYNTIAIKKGAGFKKAGLQTENIHGFLSWRRAFHKATSKVNFTKVKPAK